MYPLDPKKKHKTHVGDLDLVGIEKHGMITPMQLTWFQIAVPLYSFEYESDRSNQMVTVTTMF